MSSVPARVAVIAEHAPGRVAIVADDRHITYGELWAQAQAFARALKRNGLTTGDRLAIVLPNRIEAVIACYGGWLAGMVVVALNAQARTRDFSAWLKHCDARCVVHEPTHIDVVCALADLPETILRVPVGPEHAMSAYLTAIQSQHGGERDDRIASADTIPPERTALILYTSGTTGAPKGVALSHGNLIANAQAVVRYLDLREDDSVLSILAFYYAYGASVLHTHLISGARLVLAPNLLFPHLLMETIAREKITGFSGVPSTYALLLERVKLDQYDLSTLRYLTQAGGAMNRSLTQRVRNAISHARLYVMYGQTEATSRLTWLPPERLDDKLGSVGIPVDGVEIRIHHDNGRLAAPNEIGEVHARGANVMQGYWNNPQATATVLQDGWLHTGDLGYLDEDGFLFLVGRRSDMIKTGAHRIHPADIEEVIAELPEVNEVAVVGIDDEVLGQAIKAFVVAPRLPLQSVNLIKAHCRERLAAYKIPRDIVFVSALPRTASGKVHRAALAETVPIETPSIHSRNERP